MPIKRDHLQTMIRMTPDMAEAASRAAAKQGMTRNAWIRMLIAGQVGIPDRFAPRRPDRKRREGSA